MPNKNFVITANNSKNSMSDSVLKLNIESPSNFKHIYVICIVNFEQVNWV